jgi:alanyl-tRNA synthetase
VAPDELRFDFSHFARLTPEEIEKIEARVNEKIRAGIRLEEMRHVPIEEARAMGATALFGDKYGDFVRIVAFDRSYSLELCGGTHVANTSEIGWFTLTGESSVAAGVRRIEALTGEDARAYIRQKFRNLEAVSELLGQPRDIVKAVGNLMAEKETLVRKLEAVENNRKNREKERLLSMTENRDGLNRIVSLTEAGQADTLRQLCFEIREQVPDLFMVIAAEIEGKPHLAVMLSDNLVASRGLNAGNLARDLAKEIKGGGGGQPFFATAGGQDAAGLARMLEKARSLP